LHISPELRFGQFSIVGILFDMNRLFEEYVYRQLSKAVGAEWTVERQHISPFWEHKTLRPDILLRHQNGISFVMDTKWKVLMGPNPDDQDLRQIYVYQK